MRVLVAPDKLKGSLDAAAAARAIASGVGLAVPDAEIELCPLADGGEGTIDVLARATPGSTLSVLVAGPRGGSVDARLFVDSVRKRVFVESADAIGLARLPEPLRDPLRTSSYGLGELILHALDLGPREIVIALGGSATSDGGAGMAQALGVVFRGAPQRIAGADLETVTGFDMSARDARIAGVNITGAADVESPLLGPDGAALAYARQKGADDAGIAALERGLTRLASLCPSVDPMLSRSGAAGGLGFGIRAFLDGSLVSGADFVLDSVDFDARLKRADIVITAEGRIDAQTLAGKVVARVAERARRAGVPVFAIAGSIALEASELTRLGIESALALVGDGVDEIEAKTRVKELLSARAEALMALS